MPEIKQMDKRGLDFLIQEEGLRTKPYLDSVGIPTIGIGMTYYPSNGHKVTMADRELSKDEAVCMFKEILKHYETAVWSVTRDDINQNQFNALTSLCYNIGVNGFKNSTVVKRVNLDPFKTEIGDAFMMWKKPAVLIKRRQREVALYFS